jgi:hypothetical protein
VNRTFAEENGLLVVAPKWGADRFPFTEYHRIGVTPNDTSSGPITLWPKTQWLVQDIEYLLKDIYLKDAIDAPDDVPLYFFGHSAGGQVLNRLRLLWADCRARLVAGNPGFVTPATSEYFYPWGIAGLEPAFFGFNQIKRWIEGELVFYNGTKDTVEDWGTNTTARQGANRYDRVKYAMEWAARTAFDNGWKLGWKEVEAPGAGHISAELINSPNTREAFFAPVEARTFDTFPSHVAYVGASAYATASATSINLVVPASVEEGDRLIAFVIARSAIMPPAGWQLEASQTCASGTPTTQTLYAYSRVVQSGDASASFTWTQASTARMAGQIQVYRRPEGVAVVGFGGSALSTTSATEISYPSPKTTGYGQRIAMAACVIGLGGNDGLSMDFTAGGYAGSGNTTGTTSWLTCGNLIVYKGQINSSNWKRTVAVADTGMAAVSLLLG